MLRPLQTAVWAILSGALAASAFACGSSTETESSASTTAATSTGATGATSSGTSSTTGGAGGSSAANQACADVEKARCERGDSCFDGLFTKVKFGDEATCEARGELACLANLAAPHTGATPAGTEACAAAIPAETCVDAEQGNTPAACEPAMGTGANGTACGANAQCQSTYCAVPTASNCGYCAPEPKAGDLCATTAECGHGNLVCVKATAQCVVPVPVGGMCNKDNPCIAGATCFGDTMVVKGSCVADATAAGSKCDPAKKGPDCDHSYGLYCDALSLTCVAATYVAAGGMCGLVDNGIVGCLAGGQCVIPAGAKEGVCVAPAKDGAACDSDIGPPCLGPAKCIPAADGGTAGVCTLPDPSTCK